MIVTTKATRMTFWTASSASIRFSLSAMKGRRSPPANAALHFAFAR